MCPVNKLSDSVDTASVRESSITGAVLLPLFTVPAILRVSHLWHKRRCRPPQMRMRAKPAPLYFSLQTGSAKGRRRKKKTAPGFHDLEAVFDGADSRTPTCMRELSHGPDGSVTLVKNVLQRILCLRITH